MSKIEDAFSNIAKISLGNHLEDVIQSDLDTICINVGLLVDDIANARTAAKQHSKN